jgi:Rad3-related DNA helicase
VTSRADDFWAEELPALDAYIDATFGVGGYLARRLAPSYRPRAGQIELARAVDAAIRSRTHLLSEAPTGCHAAGQLVRMHDRSTRRVEDVALGDRLLGPDGRPRTVLGLARGTDAMVDVVPLSDRHEEQHLFDGWPTWRVNRGHVLTVVNPLCEIVDVPIGEWRGWPARWQSGSRLMRCGYGGEFETARFELRDTGTVEPFFGFTLDGDGRFLLGDFTVTHNTGKSYAYSVPASYHAAVHGQTVVIVTANISLQEQLVGKDLPLLAEILPWSFSYGLMKGRGNYLCRAQYAKYELSARQPSLLEDEASAPAHERDRLRLARWAEQEIAREGYGDRSSLDWQPADKLWREFSVGPEECRGKRCRFAESCGALGAQRVARQSQVVVCNYHVLFTHLLIWMERGVDAVLPPFDVAVLDECFPAGTLVGDIPIERVKVGDLVESYCVMREQFVRRRVLQTFCRKAGRLVRLILAGKPWVCTPGEPVLTARGWVSAGQLHINDTVLTDKLPVDEIPTAWSTILSATGVSTERTWTLVDGVEVLEPGGDGTFGGVCPDGLVYNLAVDDTNTYVANGVVVHNCHKAPDVARDFFGWNFYEGSVKRLARHVRGAEPALARDLERAAGFFFEQMLQLRRDRDRYRARVVPERLSGHDVAAAQGLLAQLGAFAAAVDRELAALGTALVGEAVERAHAAALAKNRAGQLAQAVSSVLEGVSDDEVVFLEEDEFRAAHVACRLVRPGRVLTSALFGKTTRRAVEEGATDPDERKPVAVVCTSATLATESGFGFARSELGVGACQELVVGSPFDYPNQALLILPDICDPNDPRFTAECAAVLLRTIVLARGRTLGLFTSRKRMNEVFDAIVGRTPYRILKQDDGQRTQLVDAFRRDVHSVLLGVSSFWAGVDVPGESLSVVFIDKIPFPPPDDPVVERLSETDKRAWAAYAVPRAIIELKQGFGRLIRSDTDRGVVVCCDNRLTTKGYGKQFLRAMPRGMQKVRNLEAVREWLDGPDAQQAAEEVDPLT